MFSSYAGSAKFKRCHLKAGIDKSTAFSKLKKYGKKTPGEASMKMAKMLDYNLRTIIGAGIEYFRDSSVEGSDDDVDYDSVRVLSLVLDSESSGKLAASYIATKVCCLLRYDEFHNLWNQCQNGVKSAGLWGSSVTK